MIIETRDSVERALHQKSLGKKKREKYIFLIQYLTAASHY